MHLGFRYMEHQIFLSNGIPNRILKDFSSMRENTESRQLLWELTQEERVRGRVTQGRKEGSLQGWFIKLAIAMLEPNRSSMEPYQNKQSCQTGRRKGLHPLLLMGGPMGINSPGLLVCPCMNIPPVEGTPTWYSTCLNHKLRFSPGNCCSITPAPTDHSLRL